jgi:integrase
MTSLASEPLVFAAAASVADASHVFAAEAVGERAAALAALVAPGFLAEAGWDAANLVLSPPPQHSLLGRPVCRVQGCSTTAPERVRICASCQRRLVERSLSVDELELLGVRSDPARGPSECGVVGCAREWVSSRHMLCRGHRDQAETLKVLPAEFATHPAATPLSSCGPCAVAACVRQRRHPDGLYCEAHQLRLRVARRHDPVLDVARWRLTEPPVGRGGQVSLRGLPPVVVAEVLLGLQQRCRLDGVKTKEGDLRRLCSQLRQQQVATVAAFVMPADPDGTFRALGNALVAHARRALSSPETEVVRDEWDLVVFGHSGTLSFTAITQPWLREIAKRWAADDLPKRRSATSKAGLSVRHHLGCVARLSESLRMRPDRGDVPAALGRPDMEFFLNRLAYQQAAGQISGDARIRACREVRKVLSTARAMGLTRPGGPAAGLGEDFTIGVADVPDKPEPAEPDRDLPLEIMRQLCAHLPALTSAVMRTATELAIDTGRRPEEVCGLPFDCLRRDEDGLPVLVYDNHKANRLGRRLPITESTAQLITDQKERVRARYPHTPVGELKLLPTDRRNPDGRRHITAFSLSFAHRTWVTRMPVLSTVDGAEFNKRKLVLYAYRHTYAQRHADAGVDIDVLRELMDHRKLDATKAYYRVGEHRRREAVDRVAVLQFDRHGNRVWRAAQQLLDSEHTRRAIGEVAVPFGICAEPSNVKAGGNACPFRFRCVGCDHFRTDVSYLPDLQAYLDDLLRNRERLLAATDIEQWAQAEAMPSQEEIIRVRRLITRVHAGLDELSPDERVQADAAVATIRRHRTAMIGKPRIRQPLPLLTPERTA